MRVIPYALIAVLAFGLILPAAMRPPMLQDSFWIDWVWLDQFARQLGNGDLYPRWLNQSHGGLGSPVFYYYPPLAFYAGSAFILAGLPTYSGLLGAFGFGFALSGVGMYFYLKDDAHRPMLGALLFMVAPYHLLNFYSRGAVAEFVGTGFIPFVALGLQRVRDGKGIAVLAFSYAALILTHLPLAVIVSFFFVGPYILWHRAWRALPGVAIGAGIAACYWLPALLLEPFRDGDRLWMHLLLRPGNWSVWSGRATLTPIYFLMSCVAGMVLLISAMIRSRWAGYAAACAILAVGIVPIVWDLPLLRDVQFPYRILPLAEFAVAVAIATSDKGRVLVTLFASPLLAVSALILRVPDRYAPETWPEVTTKYPDVIENLPPRGPDVARLDWVDALSKSEPLGTVFEFPAWEVRCNGALVQRPKGNILIPPPSPPCERRLVLTSAEWIGWLVSLLSLLALLAYPRILRKWRARQESNLRPHA